MGGRYGGDINRRGRGSTWSPLKALEAVGRETRAGLAWKPKLKEQGRARERGTSA